MLAEIETDSPLEIAHVLFTDIVGYSKLPTNKQRELLQLLNEIVRNTQQFRAAEAAGRLVRLPTGDEQLSQIARFAGSPTAGDLKLNPLWDEVRDHPRFNKIMAEAAEPIKLD